MLKYTVLIALFISSFSCLSKTIDLDRKGIHLKFDTKGANLVYLRDKISKFTIFNDPQFSFSFPEDYSKLENYFNNAEYSFQKSEGNDEITIKFDALAYSPKIQLTKFYQLIRNGDSWRLRITVLIQNKDFVNFVLDDDGKGIALNMNNNLSDFKKEKILWGLWSKNPEITYGKEHKKKIESNNARLIKGEGASYFGMKSKSNHFVMEPRSTFKGRQYVEQLDVSRNGVLINFKFWSERLYIKPKDTQFFSYEFVLI
jgi:hypothetical protein